MAVSGIPCTVRRMFGVGLQRSFRILMKQQDMNLE